MPDGEWTEGLTENISRSGVLFRAREPLPADSRIELRVQMPWDLTGARGAEVFCKGRVVRVVLPVNPETPLALAASIQDYRFMHDEKEAVD